MKRTNLIPVLTHLVGLLLVATMMPANADVDKVYHPYVEADTYEFESRVISLLDSELAADFSIYRFGFGKDVNDKLFLELYLIGQKETDKNIEIEAVEIEVLYQATEQGEYWVDIGLLFEIEQERESQEWETNIGLLFEKEFGRWSTSLNLQNFYEFQDNKRHAWNHSQAFQLRYRNSASFEPGFEAYLDKEDIFVGVVFLGQFSFGQNKLIWEVGLLQEVNNRNDESVLRALVEYEF
ncbi:MAG: hypothetical protein ABJI60_20550 [Kangiellaceae bacterium]